MDYLTPFDFAQLKAFFSALKQSNFNLKQIPSSVVLDGERTPINKPHCLDLLRTFPELSGDQFNEDGPLAKFLSKPDNVRRLLSHLPVAEQNELTKTIEAKPVAIGDDSMQTGGQQAPAEQPIPASQGGGMPGLSLSTPVLGSGRIIIRNVPHTPETKPEISIANKSGKIIKGPGAELPSEKIYIANKGGVVIGEHPIPGRNIGSNIGSSAKIGIKRASTRLGSSFSGMFKNMGRAGGDMVGGAIGAGGRSLGRAGLRGVDFGARLSHSVSNRGGSTFAKAKQGSRKGIIFALLGFILIAGLLTAFSPQPSTDPTGIPQPTRRPTGPVTDISSCNFTRANVSASYTSPLLLSYINTTSNLSGIPPAILAAFIRVESPGSLSMNDNQIKNYAASCPVSPTGALGIMQIQPPGTRSAAGDPASCDDCIDAGARLIGKTVTTMTRQDYCEPSTGITVASGWILKKMNNLGYQNTGQWNPAWTSDPRAINALVNTYYGCLQYGGAAECTGPYNYGTDVYTGAQNCQTQSAPPPGGSSPPPSTPPPGGSSPPPSTEPLYCPIPNGVITCGTQSTPVNGCGHCGAGYPASSYNAYCVPYPATSWGIDVAGNDFQDILLPKIGGNLVTWTYLGQEPGVTEAIQMYAGRVTDSNGTLQSYYLQFHHTQPGSGNSNAHQSGDIGGRICGNGCGERHVHIQIGDGGDGPGNTSWLDAAQYFCK